MSDSQHTLDDATADDGGDNARGDGPAARADESADVVVDRVADAFEAAWRGATAGGERPAIAPFLDGVPPAHRPNVLRELVFIDLEQRRRRGEPVAYGQYLARYPELPAAATLGGSLEAGDDGGDAGATVPEPATDSLFGGRPAGAGGDSVADTRPQLPGYDVLEPLGEGAMGTVWRAVQLSTSRDVALKLIGAAGLGSPRARGRFKREVELAAQLEHPGVARVYDSGVRGGACYYAMELVQGGRPLTDFADAAGLDDRARVRLMADVCDAVQAAHQRGIIHRDLKPGNVLVDAAGRPKVLDFGLARSVAADRHLLTVEGAVMGTPAYMSPEQAAGRSDAADTRSDVYSLGAILFQLLTGTLPHDMSGTTAQALRRVAEDEPRRPRAVRPNLDGELEAVLVKCLTRDPAARYLTAGELSAELRRFLDGDPLVARPPSTLYFLRKRITRHKGRATAAAAAVVVAAAGAVLYVVNIRAEQARTWVAKQQADRQAQLAGERAEQAGVQRTLALDTINQLIFTAQRELSRNLADDRARVALLDIARQGLKQLAAAGGEVMTADRSSAAATVMMGDTARNAGDPVLAESTYAQAVGQFERLLSAASAPPPADAGPRVPAREAAAVAAARHDLIVACVRLATARADRGRYDAADDALRRAAEVSAEVRRQAAAARPRDEDPDEPAAPAPAPTAMRDAVAIDVARGDVALQRGDTSGAVRHYDLALAAARELGAAGRPESALVLRRLAAAGEAAMRAGGDGEVADAPARARRAADAALELDRELAAADPGAPDRQRELTASLLRSARLALAAHEPARAARDAAEARAAADPAAARRPDDPVAVMDAVEAALLVARAAGQTPAGQAPAGQAPVGDRVDLPGVLRSLDALSPPASVTLARRLDHLKSAARTLQTADKK